MTIILEYSEAPGFQPELNIILLYIAGPPGQETIPIFAIQSPIAYKM